MYSLEYTPISDLKGKSIYELGNYVIKKEVKKYNIDF